MSLLCLVPLLLLLLLRLLLLLLVLFLQKLLLLLLYLPPLWVLLWPLLLLLPLTPAHPACRPAPPSAAHAPVDAALLLLWLPVPLATNYLLWLMQPSSKCSKHPAVLTAAGGQPACCCCCIVCWGRLLPWMMQGTDSGSFLWLQQVHHGPGMLCGRWAAHWHPLLGSFPWRHWTIAGHRQVMPDDCQDMITTMRGLWSPYVPFHALLEQDSSSRAAEFCCH